MTFPIVGLHNPRNTPVQSDVSFGIGGENQEMGGIWTPANLVLTVTGGTQKKTSQDGNLPQISGGKKACLYPRTLHTTACMMASKPPSGASLFLDTCCFSTSSVKRDTFSVSDSTCLNPNCARHWSLRLHTGNSRAEGQEISVQAVGYNPNMRKSPTAAPSLSMRHQLKHPRLP